MGFRQTLVSWMLFPSKGYSEAKKTCPIQISNEELLTSWLSNRRSLSHAEEDGVTVPIQNSIRSIIQQSTGFIVRTFADIHAMTRWTSLTAPEERLPWVCLLMR